MPFPYESAGMLAGGALAGGLANLTQNRGRFQKLQTMTPQQQAMSNWAGQQGQQQVSNPYSGFEPIAQRAQSMFQQQTVPTLAERFTSMGNGAMSSPAFAAQLHGAGTDLSEGLAALMAQYGLQQQGLGQNLMNMGMRPQFENAYMPSSPSFLSSIFGGLSGGLGSLGSLGMLKHFGAFGNQNDTENALGQILRRLNQGQ